MEKAALGRGAVKFSKTSQQTWLWSLVSQKNPDFFPNNTGRVVLPLLLLDGSPLGSNRS